MSCHRKPTAQAGSEIKLHGLASTHANVCLTQNEGAQSLDRSIYLALPC